MASSPPSCVTVADSGAAQRLAIELVRNALLATQNANVLATDVEKWPLLHSFLKDESIRFGIRTDDTLGYWDVRILGADRGPAVDGDVRLEIALPGAGCTVTADRRVQLVVGAPSGEVVVVPGTARSVDGEHMLTAEAFGRLKKAEQIAMQRPVRALILSGWNGRAEHGQSEAAQMLDAWRGPQIPVILDEAARTTAENALWSASLATALGDVQRVRMVTSWVSALRLGLATRAALRRTDVRLRLSVVWGQDQAASWRPAFVGLVHLRRHLRAGRALLSNGPQDPPARL